MLTPPLPLLFLMKFEILKVVPGACTFLLFCSKASVLYLGFFKRNKLNKILNFAFEN